jgi:hypothetical protein
MAGWCWFPAKRSSTGEACHKITATPSAAQSVPAIEQRRSLLAGSHHLGAELLNRLDVSKYYVIPTIIILNATVEED